MRCESMATPNGKRTVVRTWVQACVRRLIRVLRATALKLALPLPESFEQSWLRNPFQSRFPVIHSTPAQRQIAV